jgi:hypothetical protein
MRIYKYSLKPKAEGKYRLANCRYSSLFAFFCNRCRTFGMYKKISNDAIAGISVKPSAFGILPFLITFAL